MIDEESGDFDRDKPIAGGINLTRRELECLRWCSKGKTNWEIGQILDLSERTVEHYLGSAARKLGATTRAQAVAEALRIGAIGNDESGNPSAQ